MLIVIVPVPVVGVIVILLPIKVNVAVSEAADKVTLPILTLEYAFWLACALEGACAEFACVFAEFTDDCKLLINPLRITP